ncbi:universal stress protein [Flagellimonas allohymeniacidonis]|uniref:Universal stress protein n=1 Tax=Flagellimonas allohymeniacidonis TaxID=2517819 RepID=A0A4Q8QGQ2_9FLAO|nr:universal stress protein [Allomuricauda hymeniacidonis]TAI49752.1 universal stress protein [Allomuricauda hymeniacidonis]
MNKRVLIPTDFSQNAFNAIRYGMQLYSDQECDFYLLNAFQVNMYTLDNMMVPEPGNTAYETAKKQSEDGFEKLNALLKVQAENPKHRFHTISTFNSLSEAIRNVIAKKDIDLVIMGTKGFTGSDKVAFGTNTVNVMEKIVECPVMAVPENYDYAPPKKIVFPTDYKTDFKRRELKYLLEIAQLHDAQIHVLHVEKGSGLNKAQKNNKTLLEEILQGSDFQNHTLSKVKVHEGVFSFIEEQHCEMVVFVNKKHWFFGSILSNPLVKSLGYDATVPILELNDNT